MANLRRLLRIALALAFNPARIVEDAAGAARRTAILVVCALIAGFILLPAIGCAAAGLWIFVQPRLGPVWAAFITAAALVIVALVILLIGLLASRRPRDQEARRSSEQAAALKSAAASATAALQATAVAALSAPKATAAAGVAASKGVFARHKGTALLAAAVAGLVLGQDLISSRRDRKTRRS